jgi:hypothetical protein
VVNFFSNESFKQTFFVLALGGMLEQNSSIFFNLFTLKQLNPSFDVFNNEFTFTFTSLGAVFDSHNKVLQ